MLFSSTGKNPIVAPYSGHMLAMVALSAMDSDATPGPKNSTNLPTTPRCRKSYKETIKCFDGKKGLGREGQERMTSHKMRRGEERRGEGRENKRTQKDKTRQDDTRGEERRGEEVEVEENMKRQD